MKKSKQIILILTGIMVMLVVISVFILRNDLQAVLVKGKSSSEDSRLEFTETPD